MGGSAGCGKTSALVVAAISQSKNPKARSLLLRKSFPELRTIVEMTYEIYQPLGGVFNRQSSTWTFPAGSSVELGFVSEDADKFRYLGRQFSTIAWDEITSQPTDSPYVYLMSRLRATEGSGLKLQVLSTATPGGPGHAWVQSRFAIPPDGSASEVISPDTKWRRVFLPARITDCPQLAGTDYQRQLEALPEAERKSLLLGRWDAMAGQIFAEWNPAIHVCAPFTVPEDWEIWRGTDDGFSSPACCLWIARDPIYDRLYVVNELYQSRLTAREFARAVCAIDFLYERDIDGVLDSAAWADIGNGSRAVEMNLLGCNWRPAEKGAGSRIGGLAAIHSHLALKSDGLPGLIIFKNCRNLIRTLPAATYSTSGNIEDTDLADDHAIDALRYSLGRRKVSFYRAKLRGI
jgi:hypothetical protein